MILAECGRSSAEDQKEASAQCTRRLRPCCRRSSEPGQNFGEVLAAETVQGGGVAKPSPAVFASRGGRRRPDGRRRSTSPRDWRGSPSRARSACPRTPIAKSSGGSISRSPISARPNSRTSPSRSGSIRCKSASRSKPKPVTPVEPAAPARLALPDKPSIAVLPFQNMSGDPEQEYFADGMVEDIITGLSRIKWLFVIARNSSFTYKGNAVDIRQVGRELGVRYVLEGGCTQGGQSRSHHRATDRGRNRSACLGRPFRWRAGGRF